MLPKPGCNRAGRLCLLILLFQLVLLNTPLFAQKAEHVHNGLLRIKVSEGMARQLEKTTLKKNAGNTVATGIREVDGISHKFKVTSMKRVFPYAGKYEAKHRKYGLHRWYEVEFDKTIPVHQAIPGFKSLSEFEIVEPIYKKQIIGSSTSGFGPVAVKTLARASLSSTNDPMLGAQWHYNNTGQTGGTIGADIKLFDAWTRETGSPNVIVAIEDGGIDRSHEDLAANLWVNSDEIPDNGIDDDANGYIDDYNGYSFVENTGNISAHDHGTHVAGTVAAVNNNGIGVAGVAGGSGNGDGVRLMSCGVFSHWAGAGGFAEAFIYAADNGAVISQNSWTYTAPGFVEQAVLDGIDYFTAEAGKDEFGNQIGPMNGGLVIFAAANFNSSDNYYPASYEPVLSVASTNHQDVKSWYSNYGSWVDIAAPGGETNITDQGVLSTLPSNQYGFFQGTSMACPHVSGVAGLLVSQMGGSGFTPALLRSRLVQTTDKIDAQNPSYLGQLGSGRLNAANALINEDDGIAPNAISDLLVVTSSLNTLTLSWTAPADGAIAAMNYDLRYSEQPITEENFYNATGFSGLPNPLPPGSNESFVVFGLNPGTTYNFAIKASDYHGNTSAISNIAEGTTLPPPIIAVTPDQLAAHLLTAGADTLSLTVSNTGLGELTFNISIDNPDGRVSVDSLGGIIAPNSSQAVKVFLNASALFAGSYVYNLQLTSNDPVNPSVIVPITLNVTNNGAPIASLSAGTLNFNSVVLGRSKKLAVLVKNEGSDPLELQPATLNHPSFASDADESILIAPFESRVINVTFAPTEAGVVTDTLTINTNDPLRPQLQVQLAGDGVVGPSLVLHQTEINFTAYKDHTKKTNLTLTNTGGSILTWRLKEIVSDSVGDFATEVDLSASATKEEVATHVGTASLYGELSKIQIKANSLSQKKIRVLIISPDQEVNHLTSILTAYPDLEVSTYQAQWIGPYSLPFYDVVILTNNTSWISNSADPELLGNYLADYVDAGGKVIVHQMANSSIPEYQLKGRFAEENYAPFTPASSGTNGFVNLGQLLEPAHPVLEGVNYLQYNGYTGFVGLTPGSTALANWDNGTLFAAINDNVLALNLAFSNGNYGPLEWNGDLPLILHNAITHFAQPEPTYLTLDATGGTIDPASTIGWTQVRFIASDLEPGNYSTTLRLSTNDPNNAIVNIPVFMTVYGPQFSASRDSIVASLEVGESQNEVLAITHNGTQSFSYEAKVEAYGVQSVAALGRLQGFDPKKNQSPSINADTYRAFASKSMLKDATLNSSDLKSIALPPLPAVLNTAYATDFEDFTAGDINQNGWIGAGIIVDTVNAFSGKNHLHFAKENSSDFNYAVSPFIGNGPSAFSSVSMRMNLQGSGGNVEIVPLPSNGELTAGSIVFSDLGIGVYEKWGDVGSIFHALNVARPIGYFDLTIESNEITGQFSVYFDDTRVFNGLGHKGNAANVLVAAWASGDFTVNIDDVRLYDGKKFDKAPAFVNISPREGIILPQETVHFDVLLKADSIGAGIYPADVSFYADRDAVVIPVILNVASHLSVAPSSIEMTVMASEAASTSFTITNSSENDTPFRITAVTGFSSASQTTAAATVAMNNSFYQALKTRTEEVKNIIPVMVAADSTWIKPTATGYETGFEDFSLGLLREHNWYGDDNVAVTNINPAEGAQHVRMTAANGFSYISTPAVTPGNATKSAISIDVDMNGQIPYWDMAVYGASRLVTVFSFNNNEIYVLTYIGNNTFQSVRIYEDMPSSFFNLAIEVDKATGQFNLVMDGRVVFTGQSGDNNITFSNFGVSGDTGGTLDLDNFRIIDGNLYEFAEALSFSPDSGVIAGNGTQDVTVNINTPLNAGQYNANIVVHDAQSQLVIPLTVTVIKPELRVSPDSLYQELTTGQMSSQYITLENIGGSVTDYKIIVTPNGINSALAQMAKNNTAPKGLLQAPPRSLKQVSQQLASNPDLKIDPALFGIGKIEQQDSVASLYASSFEEFELGNAAQNGWALYGKPWVISDSLPYTGQKHMSLHLEPDSEHGEGHAFSPYVAVGTSGYVTSSTKVHLHGSDMAVWIIAQSQSGGLAAGLYQSNGSVYIYSNSGFQWLPIQLPEGYFDLAFQVNRHTNALSVFIDQEPIFTGYAFSNNIVLMEYIGFNPSSGEGYFDIDDVRILDGPLMPVPYLTVSPSAGIVYPYSATALVATFDATDLPTGMYLADIDVKVNDRTVASVATALNVLGLPQIEVSPASHEVTLDYRGFDTRNIAITNPGGQALYFNIAIEDPQAIASVSPVAKRSRNDEKTLLKLEEDARLSVKPSTQKLTPVSIVTGKTLGGEQFENGVPPSQWSVINNTATGPQWNTASSYGEGNYSYNGEAATVSSDAFGSAPLNTELISPVYDVKGHRYITLQYYANYQNYGSRDFLDLAIRVNGQSEWTTISSWNEDHGQFRSWGEFISVNLDQYLLTATTFQLRWHYYDSNPGAYDWYAQIDNVSIIGESVPWLTLSQSWGFVNPGDQFNMNMYVDASLLPNGSFEKLIKVYSNAENAPAVDVPVLLTVKSAPKLVFAPDSISERVYINTSSNQQAIISNAGESALTYSFIGNYAPELAKNDVSRIYPTNQTVDKNIADTRVGHPVIAGFGGPDAGQYTWIDSNEPGGPVFNWEDIRFTGTPVYLGDDTSLSVGLPFAFAFYENNYSNVTIGSNGYLTFGGYGSSYGNSELPNSNEPNNIIAAFWDDLYPGYGGGVSYQTIDDKFIVQYTDVPFYNSSGNRNTFQIILHRDGNIVLQYLTMGSSASATTGIENSTGSSGLQVVFNAPYISNNQAILISNSGPKWLRVSPNGGTLAGHSSADIALDFIADGLAAGKYNSDLVISSNDEDAPFKRIPVELTVFDNYTPVIDSISDLSIIETQNASLTVTAHDNDDPSVTLSILNKPSFMTVTASGNGTVTYLIKPGIGDKGDYEITVEAMDTRGLKSQRKFYLKIIPYGVQNFSVIDKRNGQVILNFAGSVTLNKADAAYPYYQIRANTNPASVGSVQFQVDGKNAKSSATAPYLLADTDFKNLKVGNHKIKATAYTLKSNKGQVGALAEATVAIVNQPLTTSTVATSLIISPNPVENELNVKLSGDQSGDSDLEIVDGTGYVVYRAKITFEQLQDLKINVSGLPRGIYYLQLTRTTGQRITSRIVKN